MSVDERQLQVDGLESGQRDAHGDTPIAGVVKVGHLHLGFTPVGDCRGESLGSRRGSSPLGRCIPSGSTAPEHLLQIEGHPSVLIARSRGEMQHALAQHLEDEGADPAWTRIGNLAALRLRSLAGDRQEVLTAIAQHDTPAMRQSERPFQQLSIDALVAQQVDDALDILAIGRW